MELKDIILQGIHNTQTHTQRLILNGIERWEKTTSLSRKSNNVNPQWN